MFEEQYKEMVEAIDEIAERIRALGFHAPGTFRDYFKMTSITEDTVYVDADQMIINLVAGHEAVSSKANEVMQIAAVHQDEATVDLLTSRIKRHEKAAWMLRSLLE